MTRHDAVVVVCRRNQSCGIIDALTDIVNGRISVESFEFFSIVARTVIGNLIPADGEFMEAQHIHHTCLLNNDLKKFGTLVGDRADEQAAV